MNEADEVVHGSRFVVRDLKDDRRYDLPDSPKVGVGRLSVYRIELIERIGEIFHNFSGRRCVCRWRILVVFGVKCRLRGLKEQ